MQFTNETARDAYRAEKARLEKFRAMNLSLDMSRGKPCAEQIELSLGLLDEYAKLAGTAKRYLNYGSLDGIPEAKALFASLCRVDPESEIMVCGNSSLNVMYDCLIRAMQYGVLGGTPLCRQPGELKWLCPVPGYDRHFAITESLGFKMINIPMDDFGPDMSVVEECVKDPAVKGIWCVPKYSNPHGCVYSAERIERFARLRPASPDFRAYWDNAYMLHDFNGRSELADVFAASKAFGSSDLFYMFGSTSKMTIAGAGVAWLCASRANISDMRKRLSVQTIGYNKLNQLAHVNFFESAGGIRAHMSRHAAILRPKFDLCQSVFAEELTGLCSWSKPDGGYFISLNVPAGLAKKTVALAKSIGVTLTPAGSAFPYRIDPNDSNIRIAPTYPSLADLGVAMRALCCCAKYVWAESLIT